VLTLGHKVHDSATGEVTTTVEQRVRPFAAYAGPVAAWDGPQRAAHPLPPDEAGFLPSARSIVRSWEAHADGVISWQHLIHRLSGACLHACAAFGMTPGYMRQNRRGYSTFELDLAIERLPPVGTRIAVATGIMQIGNSSIRLLHAMRDAETGALLARMSQFGVHFDMDRRRPAPLPDDLREAALGLVRKAS
jgi:acyl-CoA thioesterase FadM